MLERVLSLIPKKENGDFKHGAKKKFAVDIGFKSGEIISDWIAGRSKSYEGYLYQIAAIHNVSVEWLKGETEDSAPAGQKEKPPAQGGELSEKKRIVFEKLSMLNSENVDKAGEFLDFLLARQEKKETN